jgi:hypothetical protein
MAGSLNIHPPFCLLLSIVVCMIYHVWNVASQTWCHHFTQSYLIVTPTLNLLNPNPGRSYSEVTLGKYFGEGVWSHVWNMTYQPAMFDNLSVVDWVEWIYFFIATVPYVLRLPIDRDKENVRLNKESNYYSLLWCNNKNHSHQHITMGIHSTVPPLILICWIQPCKTK